MKTIRKTVNRVNRYNNNNTNSIKYKINPTEPKSKDGVRISLITATFLEMLNIVKLYHWNTTMSQHQATDELYSSLNNSVDEFIEVMLGKRRTGFI
jgi:DNA-binding ferritin-like protein